VKLGQDVNLVVDFKNFGDLPTTCTAHLARSVIFYTGVTANRLQDKDFSVTVPANQTERVVLSTSAQEYMSQLSGQHALYFVLSGKADGQSVNSMKVVELVPPSLSVSVSGVPQVQGEMFVNLSFINPFSFPLLNVGVAMEGSGLLNYRARYYSVIEPQASITWSEAFYPRLIGIRRLSAVMACSNLPQVSGHADIMITG
ncbi:coagulation factor XIII A chain-like, partial [Scomber scombrus]